MKPEARAKARWCKRAAALISTMREPAENMLYQAHRATGGDILVGEAREVWQAMIDGALQK